MSVFATAILALQLTGAPVQDFTPVRVADSDIRGSVRALNQGDWATALHFSRAALDSGSRTSVRAAAHANACIALHQLGQTAEAAQACETALALAPNNAVLASNLSAVQTRMAGAPSAGAGN
ncbi:hypothetical protein ABWI01_11250 [Oceanicaulis alexandrii]|uniref:hypothetical protein n=1 Tax=Oceanicaulis TaxID=153232 RepID=UPI0035D03294